MAILADKYTRVLVQGITGSEGSFHTSQMIMAGTKVVAGVTPGKGGEVKEHGIPVYDTVREAVQWERPDASVIFVPPGYAADSILEAIDAEIGLIVCITEHVPINDMVKVYEILKKSNSKLLGPNCPGLVTPGQCKIGIMPYFITQPGHIGVVSRSGTLTYETVSQLTKIGLGQSTCVGIGGDPIIGSNFTDIIKMFHDDPETHGIIMIGEIGGSEEEKAAAFIKAHVKKPVVGFIAGQTAPPGKRMGHAGAIISGGLGTATSKMDAMRDAGIHVVDYPSMIGETMKQALAAKQS